MDRPRLIKGLQMGISVISVLACAILFFSWVNPNRLIANGIELKSVGIAVISTKGKVVYLIEELALAVPHWFAVLLAAFAAIDFWLP